MMGMRLVASLTLTLLAGCATTQPRTEYITETIAIAPVTAERDLLPSEPPVAPALGDDWEILARTYWVAIEAMMKREAALIADIREAQAEADRINAERED